MRTERPLMPGYGISEAPDGLLPWEWAQQHLTSSHSYWLATRTPQGAPHMAAVWAVWFDGAVCFSTGARSRKARNLAADPRCCIAPTDAGESVVVEGTAVRVTEPARLAEIEAVYRAKYGSGFPDPSGDPVFAVRPAVVFGIIDGEPEFTTRATRWTFSPEASA
jgi:hypothetical protein